MLKLQNINWTLENGTQIIKDIIPLPTHTPNVINNLF